MDVPHQEIVDTIRKIKTDSYGLTKKQMDKKYADFKEKFPKLYEMAPLIRDWTEFEVMLRLREQVKTGSKPESIANFELGEHMGKKYIYPKVGEPTLEEKKKAINKILAGKK